MTYDCNLSCQTCRIWTDHFRFSRVSQKQSLSLDRIQHILEELAAEGLEKITFLGGEPFLHPDLCAMAEHARKSGLQTAVVTNGTVITQAIAEKVVCDELFDILIFSLDGPQSVHDRIRGRNGIFKASTDNIRFIQKLRKARKQRSPKIYIYTTVSSLNSDEADQMLSIARKLDAHELRFVSASFVGEEIRGKTNALLGCEALSLHSYSAGQDIKIPPEKLQGLKDRLQKLKAEAQKIGLRVSIENVLTDNPEKSQECPFVGKDMIISFNGDVYPCPMLPQYTLGNLAQKPLKEILNSPESLSRVNRITELFENHTLPVCPECCVEKRRVTDTRP